MKQYEKLNSQIHWLECFTILWEFHCDSDDQAHWLTETLRTWTNAEGLPFDCASDLKHDLETERDKVFMLDVFELAFGDGATPAEYSRENVLRKIKEFSDKALEPDQVDELTAYEVKQLTELMAKLYYQLPENSEIRSSVSHGEDCIIAALNEIKKVADLKEIKS